MIRSLFGRSRWFRPSGAHPCPVAVLPRSGPLYAVGDIHGCLSLYRLAEAQVQADAGDEPATVVLLGDMVDRGAQTADLLDHLCRRPPNGLTRLCLRGNHEQMMLDFLASPRRNQEWLTHGGTDTLRSYGLDLGLDEVNNTPERSVLHRLAAVIPDAHVAFLRGLPMIASNDDIVCAHASIDPDLPLDRQSVETLLWGLPPMAAPRGRIFVHGHTVVPAPVMQDGVLALDTGAYLTGTLGGARFRQENVEPFTVSAIAGGASPISEPTGTKP